jgi:hypothetical protein
MHQTGFPQKPLRDRNTGFNLINMQNDEYDASNRDQTQSPNDVIVRSGESGNERQLGFSTIVPSKPNIILTVDGGKNPGWGKFRESRKCSAKSDRQ